MASNGYGIMNSVANWMNNPTGAPEPTPRDDVPSPNKEKARKLREKMNQSQSEYWNEKWNNLKEGLAGR